MNRTKLGAEGRTKGYNQNSVHHILGAQKSIVDVAVDSDYDDV
jgi:hypothetical protein